LLIKSDEMGDHLFSGAAAAGAIGMINSFGNIGEVGEVNEKVGDVQAKD
jgi:hypothetical protein